MASTDSATRTNQPTLLPTTMSAGPSRRFKSRPSPVQLVEFDQEDEHASAIYHPRVCTAQPFNALDLSNPHPTERPQRARKRPGITQGERRRGRYLDRSRLCSPLLQNQPP